MVPSKQPRLLTWLFVTLATVCVISLSACAGGKASRPTSMATAPESTTAAVAASSAPAASSSADQAPTPAAAPPTATALPIVPTASALTVRTLAGKELAKAGWTTNGVVLSFRAPARVGEALVPQIEVVKAGQPFTGTPTAQGTPTVPQAGQVSAQITLKDLAPGQYAWQARFASNETKRVGAWAPFGNGDATFGIAGQPPTIQKATVEGTDQEANGMPLVGAKDQASVQWSAVAEPTEALAQIVYLADHQATAPATIPANAMPLDSTTSSLPLTDLQDGTWYIHLWAQDKAGRVSAPSTVAVAIMREPLQISDVIFRTWATNPQYQTIPIQFTISRAATVTLTIFPESSTTIVRRYNLGQQAAGKPVKTTWDGKDARGAIVPVGSYRFLVDAVDAVGNDAQGMYSGLTITDKVIKISLGTQSLTAYEGDKPFLTTLVTSGGVDLPTPTGQFEILEKSAPFVFHSPYPKGSKYWYADVTSNYAMLFYQQDADFIHDAPWRSKFGPGTNGPGIPGQPYTGSHGCVELPANAMPRLYPWTPLGTPVVITQ